MAAGATFRARIVHIAGIGKPTAPETLKGFGEVRLK